MTTYDFESYGNEGEKKVSATGTHHREGNNHPQGHPAKWKTIYIYMLHTNV